MEIRCQRRQKVSVDTGVEVIDQEQLTSLIMDEMLLEFREDGTGTTMVDGAVGEFSYKNGVITSKEDNSTANYLYSDGKLTLVDDIETMVLRRFNKIKY